jgi:hypothetical protein
MSARDAERRIAAFLALETAPIKTTAKLPVHKHSSFKHSGLKSPHKVVHKPGGLFSRVTKHVDPLHKKGHVDAFKKNASDVSITEKQRAAWEQNSPEKQKEYLESHPDSIFHKLGISKKHGHGLVPDKESNDNEDGDSGASMRSPIEARDMTEAERNRGQRHAADLSKPGALNPNSKEREEAASALERDGVGAIKAAVPHEGLSSLHSAIKGLFGEARSKRHSDNHKPKGDMSDDDIENAENDDSPDDDDEDPDDRDERISRRKTYKNVAYVAGGLACAALLGIGIAAMVNPAFALVLGYQFLDKLPDFLSTAIDAVASDTIETDPNADDQMQEFVEAVADYLRDAKLPKDAAKHLSKLVASPSTQPAA